jgi:hypothetical protein
MALFQNTHSTITTVSQSGIKMGIEPQNADRQIGIGRGA